MATMETPDTYSLSNLQDIIVPAPPGLWPPAAGALSVILAATVAALLLGWYLYYRRRRKSYRRIGRALLQDVTTEHELSVLLKRIALVAYPRQEIASLYGEKWIVFLNRTALSCRFPEDFTVHHSRRVSKSLLDAAACWIDTHKVPVRLKDGH